MKTTETCFLILRTLTDDEIKLLDLKENVISTIKNKQLKNSTFHDLDLNFFDILHKECFDIVSSFGHKSIKGKKIVDWLSYDSKNYWYYLRFSLFHSYLPVYKERKTIEKLRNNISSKKIIIYSHYKHDDKLEYITPNKVNSNKKLIRLVTYCFLFFIRSLIGFWKNLAVKRNKHAILLEPYNLQKIVDINDPSKIILGDYYNEYLTNLALKNSDFSFVSDFYPPQFNTSLKLKKAYFFNKYSKKSMNFEFYYLCVLLNPLELIKLYKFKKRIDSRFRLLMSNDNKQNLDTTFCLNFIKSKTGLLSFMRSREKASQIMIKWKKLKSITCHHEFSYHHYSIINGAKSTNTPTISFQHGIIHPLHIHYIFDKKDNIYNPLPDKLITWGIHWENILKTTSIYTDENVVTLGQIRTDIISKLKLLKLNNHKKTIVYASQPSQMGVELRYKLANDFLTLSKKFKNINFIIKPHPGEKNAIQYFNSIAKKIETNNFSISFDDLYLTLNSCDALVTYSSTVASEAIYFKKPVFLLDYQDSDVSNYTKYKGAVFKATNINQFENLILQLLNDELSINDSVQNEFITNFAHTIDGQISNNYLNFIKSTSKEK